MTSIEFNRERQRCRAFAMVFFFAFMGVGISAYLREVEWVVVFSVALCGSWVFMARAYRGFSRFRCPSCGEDPLSWCANDGSADGGFYDPLTDHCLHCKVWIGP